MSRLRWPLPALLAWGACWAVLMVLRAQGAAAPIAVALVALLGVALGIAASTPWRRVFVGAGFPLSLAASGLAGSLPAWAWLWPMIALLLIYPINAWRDAPVFPTPKGALRGLAAQLALPEQARVLDAGCGLGDALIELRRELPHAGLVGIEWSWPLRLACALRCPFAIVRRGDIWSADWSAFDLVYVFQRPESMARAADKAAREMRPGAWLASLEFELPSYTPARRLRCDDGRALWLYRLPLDERRASAPHRAGAAQPIAG